jgi:hypothetical protein
VDHNIGFSPLISCLSSTSNPGSPSPRTPNLQVVQLLIERGANVNFKDKVSSLSRNICTCLGYSVGEIRTNPVYKNGTTPLIFACGDEVKVSLDIVKLLVDNGANVNSTDKVSMIYCLFFLLQLSAEEANLSDPLHLAARSSTLPPIDVGISVKKSGQAKNGEYRSTSLDNARCHYSSLVLVKSHIAYSKRS